MLIVQHPVIEDAVKLRRHPDFGAGRVPGHVSPSKRPQKAAPSRDMHKSGSGTQRHGRLLICTEKSGQASRPIASSLRQKSASANSLSPRLRKLTASFKAGVTPTKPRPSRVMR